MEKPITCIVVDDEPLARKLLERFIARVPFLELVGSCSNALEAMDRFYETKADLLLLDVRMPELTGFNLLDVLQNDRPQIILTTAYMEYAVRGFDYEVTDYLQKPIQFERFLRAVNKVRVQLQQSRSQSQPLVDSASSASVKAQPGVEPVPPADPYIWLTVNKTRFQLNTQEILFLESLKDYVKIHLATQTLTVRSALHKLEQLLPLDLFIRINRSYLVRREAILALRGNTIELINKQQLPIGISYLESVRQKLK